MTEPTIKLRCVDNSGVTDSLTIDKIYEAFDDFLVPPHFVQISIDDKGVFGEYINDRFKRVTEDEANAPIGRSHETAPIASSQVGGTHYTDMAIQPYEYCLKNGLGPCETNAISYISRWKAKGGLQDLKKAVHTLQILIEFEEASVK